MSGILWECGAAERSGASTALVALTQVRESQCKHLKNLFDFFMYFFGNLRCRNQSVARAALSIWAFIPIHVAIFQFLLSLSFIVIEPGCYRSFLFII